MGPDLVRGRIEKITKFRHKGEQVAAGIFRLAGDVPFFRVYDEIERFNRSAGTGLKLIRPAVADSLVSEPGFSSKFSDGHGRLRSMMYPAFPVNLLVAVERPGAPLEDRVVFNFEGDLVRMIFPVPLQHRGKKDVALSVQDLDSSCFQRDQSEIVVRVPEDKIRAVSDFPLERGNYLPSAETGMLSGRKILGSVSRHMDRTQLPYVGVITRWADPDPEHNRMTGYSIGTVWVPEAVVVEIAEADLAKFNGSAGNGSTERKLVLETRLSASELKELLRGASASAACLDKTVNVHMIEPIRRLVARACQKEKKVEFAGTTLSELKSLLQSCSVNLSAIGLVIRSERELSPLRRLVEELKAAVGRF